MSSLLCTTGKFLALAATLVFASSAALTDGNPGSPRAIAVAVGGLLVALAAYIAHRCESQGTTQTVKSNE